MEHQNLFLIVEFLLTTAVAGIVGTAGMSLFMHLITRSGVTNANMMGAIGSLLTKSMESAFLVGGILHFISGIGFAMLYTLLFNFFSISGFLASAGVGLAFGFAHGFVLSFVLVASVAEHHPLPEFRDAGIFVAVAHLIGHVIYGFLVGSVVGLYGFTIV